MNNDLIIIGCGSEQGQLAFGTDDDLVLETNIVQDDITAEIEKIFDYDCSSGVVQEHIKIPTFPTEYQIGLIVGGSGTGKSTILNRCFGSEEKIVWDENKSIASHFESFSDASNRFGAVGLNSIPTWLKPYHVLSNGEKFRADLARRLKDGAVIDEFTSVVNREVAMSCSISISKYIRKNNIKNVTFASCHDDIIQYLQPDWVYNTDTHEFYSGRYLCRPKINLEIHACRREVWSMFRKYHYLSGKLNNTSICYMATINDSPVAFLALITFPGQGLKHAYREHRLVVLPDYQGMGIGNKFSETIAQAYIEHGCQYFCKTSNPRIGDHRDNSPLWRGTAKNHLARTDYITPDGKPRLNKYFATSKERVEYHSHRVCFSHEYIGNGKTYPYTLREDQQNTETGQMTIEQWLGEKNVGVF